MSTRQHWESIYTTKSPDQVSWYQRRPVVSVELIRRVAPQADAAIIDAGGGASTLADELIASGYTRVTVCDIAETALRQVRARTSGATFLCADILAAPLPPAAFDVWHDRAVFHFLTAPEDRRKYVDQVSRALRPSGHVVMATFAEDGPTRCSGLDAVRYSAPRLHETFGPRFDLIETRREEHVTPGGTVQAFQYCVFRV